MPLYAALLLSAVVGYGLGSIPWAHLAARRNGVDIGGVDTGIAGAANVFRQVGRVWGAAVFAGDAGKGAAAVVAANAVGAEGALALPALAGAVLGHCWPLLGRAPGGVGLAVLGGGAAAVGGLAGVVSMAFGVAMVGALRNAGYAAGLGFALFGVLGMYTGVDPAILGGVFGLCLTVLAWARLRQKRRG